MSIDVHVICMSHESRSDREPERHSISKFLSREPVLSCSIQLIVWGLLACQIGRVYLCDPM